MKQKLILAFVCLLFTGVLQAQRYTVATFNIRYDNPRDSGNLWVTRAPVVANLIRFHDFDVFGTQEGLKNQLDDISQALPEYERYGVGRNDGVAGGEHSAIFYRKDKFTVLDKGDFWLSQTPEKPSLGWDATCCNRICSWVKLQDKTSGKQFYFFNAHYDHQGKQARIESSKLILAKMKTIAGNAPVIFTGDLNGDQKSEPYHLIAQSEVLKDSYGMVSHPYASNATFNGFTGSRGRTEIIDHIFVSRHFDAVKWGILTDTYHGRYPSDHFPVMAVVTLK